MDTSPRRTPSLLVIRERRGSRFTITLYYVDPDDGPTWITGLSEVVATIVIVKLAEAGGMIYAGYRTGQRLGVERAA